MTQAMLSRWLGAVLALGLLALPLRADQPKADQAKPSQPYVVLVGISNYADKQIKPRAHAEDDAKAVYELFTNKKYLGVDAEHSRLLLGDSAKVPGSQAATRDNILKSLRWIAANAKTNDLVIFGFFGEGGPLGDTRRRTAAISPPTRPFEGRDKNAVAASEVGEALKKLKSKRFCVLLDVDFKGFTTKDKKVAEPTLGSNPYKEFLGTDDTEEEAALPGRALFLASNGLIRSLDLKDHGVFTEGVLRGLKGAADKDGYEPDGVVTVDELTEYLDKEVRELIRTNAKTKEAARSVFRGSGRPRQSLRPDAQSRRGRQGQGAAGQVRRACQGRQGAGEVRRRGQDAAVAHAAAGSCSASSARSIRPSSTARSTSTSSPAGARPFLKAPS